MIVRIGMQKGDLPPKMMLCCDKIKKAEIIIDSIPIVTCKRYGKKIDDISRYTYRSLTAKSNASSSVKFKINNSNNRNTTLK